MSETTRPEDQTEPQRLLASLVNEFAARLARDHPERFRFFATLPLPDVDGALEEAAYAFDTLRASGVIVLANVLSLPIVFGAALLKVGHLLKTGIPAGETTPLLIGIASSAVFGYLSVVILLKLVQRHSLYPFVWYRLLAGGTLLIWLSVAR